jgi:hypothetical protein
VRTALRFLCLRLRLRLRLRVEAWGRAKALRYG